MTENSVSTTDTNNPNRSSTPRGLGEWVKYALSILILAGGVAIYFGLSSLAKKSEEQASEQLVPLISTEAIQPYAGQIDMVVSGSVVPYREIKVAAKVNGNVVKKHPNLSLIHI